MPMNEYRRSDPRLLTSATALFESGVGRGSNLGSGTANRSDANKKRRSRTGSLIIAGDSTWLDAFALEPRLSPVRAIFFSEPCFEDYGLFARADDLHRNQDEQQDKEFIRPMQREQT